MPRNAEFKSIKDLENRRIATSYPHTVQTFLDREGIKAKIHEISGSVEISPNIGLADAICDIVSTGSTLFKNGLTEVYTIFKFEAVLAANPNLSEKKKEILTRLIFRIESVLRARNTKYIMLNAHKKDVENICSILPGLKSPTIIPLEEPDWVSIHSVILEDEFWDLIDQLKQNNAENILILPIEKILV